MVKIDKNKCIGCGVCASLCPDGFAMSGRLAQVKNQSADCLPAAAQACPVGAILISPEDNKPASDSQPTGQESDLAKSANSNSIGPGQGFGRGRGFGFGRRRRHGRGHGFGFGRRGQK